MTIKSKRVRLDSLLIEKGLIDSWEKAKALILAGKVIVNGAKADKPGVFVRPDAELDILQKMPYVGRGGIKLEAALKNFNIDVKGKIAMDIGASTGGFTDCLLQHGCKKVYAVDVGYGQLDWKLRNDPRVILLEKTNIRHLDEKIKSQPPNARSASPRRRANPCLVRSSRVVKLGKSEDRGHELDDLIKSNIDIATVDVSFISLLKVIPSVKSFLKKNGEIVALIKPQFEVAREDVGKGGVVKNKDKRDKIIEKIINEFRYVGLEVKGTVQSKLVGLKGNIEHFVYFKKMV